jgi:hypothetical protein
MSQETCAQSDRGRVGNMKKKLGSVGHTPRNMDRICVKKDVVTAAKPDARLTLMVDGVAIGRVGQSSGTLHDCTGRSADDRGTSIPHGLEGVNRNMVGKYEGAQRRSLVGLQEIEIGAREPHAF